LFMFMVDDMGEIGTSGFWMTPPPLLMLGIAVMLVMLGVKDREENPLFICCILLSGLEM